MDVKAPWVSLGSGSRVPRVRNDGLYSMVKARLAKRVGALSTAEAKAVLGQLGEMFGK